MDRMANQRKVLKWLPFKNISQNHSIFMCIYLGHMATDNVNVNDNDGQSMIAQGSLVDKPNKPKSQEFIQHIYNIPHSRRYQEM